MLCILLLIGAKGMALFFATHECSKICEDLLLEKFDLSAKEKERITALSSRSSTTTEVKCGSPTTYVVFAVVFFNSNFITCSDDSLAIDRKILTHVIPFR